MSRHTSWTTPLLARLGLVSSPSPAYRGVLLGLAGGLVGTLAMGQYWTRIAPLLTPKSGEQEGEAQPDQNVISPLGQQHENGESATAALGRQLYELLMHQTPGKETRTALSEAVHWSMGALSGSVYGALSARSGAAPLSGVGYGAALWLGMDEAAVPLLGLQDGPASGGVGAHLNRLGAHLCYGAALGFTIWTLDKLLPD